METSAAVKKIAYEAGADLCGLASVNRFNSIPGGFKPTDLFPPAKTVIVFALKVPEAGLFAASTIPYSYAEDMALFETQKLAFHLAVSLEKIGMQALPVPSEPYDYWDSETMTGKGLLSLKHAGYFAGLGVIGRNSLLCSPEYGNLIKLGAILVDAELESDPVLGMNLCPDTCGLCIKSCPSGALAAVSGSGPGKSAIEQKKCRQCSEGSTKKGAPITVCFACRKACPNRAGWKTAERPEGRPLGKGE